MKGVLFLLILLAISPNVTANPIYSTKPSKECDSSIHTSPTADLEYQGGFDVHGWSLRPADMHARVGPKALTDFYINLRVPESRITNQAFREKVPVQKYMWGHTTSIAGIPAYHYLVMKPCQQRPIHKTAARISHPLLSRE